MPKYIIWNFFLIVIFFLLNCFSSIIEDYVHNIVVFNSGKESIDVYSSTTTTTTTFNKISTVDGDMKTYPLHESLIDVISLFIGSGDLVIEVNSVRNYYYYYYYH